ncbi:hypothetical protein ACTGZQ_10760 [Streptococcus suis]
MVKVSVESKSDLLDLASSANLASDFYKEATAAAYQSFTLRTSGGGGSALDSFVGKINALSEQVFVRYPEILSDYATAVTTYASSLEGEGFSGDLVYSKKDDIDGIVTWLTQQRYNSIDEKGDALDQAFRQAATVLSSSPAPVELGNVNTKQIVSDAYEELNRKGKSRLRKHGKLTSALKTFKTSLEQIEGDLIAIQSSLENAHYVGQVPATTFVGWLTSGQLTSQNMNLVDHIRDSGDDEMLGVLLNEGENKEEFFSDLGAVDATHVSSGMMDLAYGRFLANATTADGQWIPDNFQAFFDSLSQQDQHKVTIYMEKLSLSGARAAAVTTKNVMDHYPDFPEPGSPASMYETFDKEMAQLQESGQLEKAASALQKMGQLNSLFESVYVMKVGKYYQDDSPVPYYDKLENLTVTDGGFTWERVNYVNDKYTGTAEAIDTAYTVFEDNIRTAQGAAEYAKLQQKKVESVRNLFMDMAALAAHPIPGATSTIEIVSSLLTTDSTSSAISSFNDAGKAVFDSTYSEGVEGGGKGLSKMIRFFEEMTAISALEQDARDSINGSLFDIGGTIVTPTTSDRQATFNMTYDLQAILQSQDMQENGLRSYVYRMASGGVLDKVRQLDAFDGEIKNGKIETTDQEPGFWDQVAKSLNQAGDTRGQDKIHVDALAFLAGQSDKSLSEIGSEKIADALRIIINNRDGFGLDGIPMQDYISKNTQYYQDLTGDSKDEKNP